MSNLLSNWHEPTTRYILKPIALGIIKAYQLGISPWFLPSCRFYPTCSHYAVEALQTKNFFSASALITKRILRCHPLCEGGYDPVPKGGQ